MSSHEEHPDAHLYESDRRLFRDRIRENTTTNNNSNDDLLATHRRETEQLLYASDASLFSQGADLWLSDRLLYRTKRDFDDESLRRDVERLRTESGFVFHTASTTRADEDVIVVVTAGKATVKKLLTFLSAQSVWRSSRTANGA